MVSATTIGDKKDAPKKTVSNVSLRKQASKRTLSSTKLAAKKKQSRIQMESTDRKEEPSVNEEEEYSAIPAQSNAPNNDGAPSPQTPPAPVPDCIIPPTFHFVPVSIQLLPEMTVGGTLNTILRLTTNMLIGTVRKEYMTLFISGDLLCSLNGIPIWDQDHLQKALMELKIRETTANPIIMTVIRPFNITPPTRAQLATLPVIDERFQYFNVRMGMKNLQGFATRFDKKRLIVSKIKASTSPSYSLLVGDQILAIGTTQVPYKGSRKQCLALVRSVWTSSKSLEYVEVFACRPISARSSPCPSIDGELAERFPKQGNRSDRKEKFEDINVLLEGDSLEIAFRELVCLKQSIKPESSLPYTCKGRSLLRAANNNSNGTRNNNTTNLGPSASNSTTNVSTDRSMYIPTTSSTTPQTLMTPRKFKWNPKQSKRQQKISIQESAETTKITSDIAEESELKKCDPRSGIVAYIKNAFNN